MGLSLDEIGSLGDAINYVGDNTASSAAGITQMLQRNGGLLKSTTGLATAQIAALSAAFDAAAPNTESAATAQKNFILALTSGESATTARKEALEKIGLSAVDLAERMQTDAKGAITDVLSSLNQLSDAERGSVMAELFGAGQVDVIAGLVGNLGELSKTMGLVADKTKYAGSMQSEYERKMGTAGTAKVKMKNSMIEIGYILGDVLLPPLATVFGVVGNLAVRFGDFAASNPKVTKTVIGLAVGLVTGLTAVVALGYAINIMRTGLVYTRMAFIGTSMAAGRFGSVMSLTGMRMAVVSGATKGWAAAQWLLNSAMSANPIGLLIVGVGALIGLGVLLYKKWEPFRKLIDGIGGTVKKIGGAVGKFFGFGKGDKKDEQKADEHKMGNAIRATAPNRQIRQDRTLSPPPQAQSRTMISPYKISSQSQQQKNITVHVKSSPTIVVQGGSVDGAKAALAGHEKNVADQVKKAMEKEQRLSYG